MDSRSLPTPAPLYCRSDLCQIPYAFRYKCDGASVGGDERYRPAMCGVLFEDGGLCAVHFDHGQEAPAIDHLAYRERAAVRRGAEIHANRACLGDHRLVLPARPV